MSATNTPATRIPLIFGAATFGNAGATQVNTVPEAQAIVDLFRSHGHKVFDTSRLYGNGTSEEFLSQLDLKGGLVDTKVAPLAPGDHSPEKLRATVQTSVKTLAPHKINVLFLHWPDRSVPYVDTMREVNELYKQGLFKEFGLSNFNSWEVAEIYTTAKLNGWVVPTVYEGVYNAVQRGIEVELIPCLRKYGIRFHAYSPLGAGLLSGTVLKEEDMHRSDGSRWDDKASPMAEMIRALYRPLFPAVQALDVALKAHKITFPAAALRWLQHHSALTPSDAVIIGAKNLAQTKGNLIDSEGGPLPEDVIQSLENAWKTAKVDVKHYSLSL